MEVIKKNNGIQVFLCGTYHWFSELAAIELRDKLDALLVNKEKEGKDDEQKR